MPNEYAEFIAKEAKLNNIAKDLCDATLLVQDVSLEWANELAEMARRVQYIRCLMTGPTGI